MKVIRFVLSFVVTLTLVGVLNIKIDRLPPLGKFLNPHGGFWQNSERVSINAPQSLNLEGLRNPVKIQFDGYLIPHIFAENEEDLMFAQGYVTAYHRLWQMEFQLLSTAGRISEILGKSALDYDRAKRRNGMSYGARRSVEQWKSDPEYFKLVEAYTAGVNAYIETVDYADLPIEYKLLDYTPEPWTEYKCALLLREMASTLSRGEADLENTNALRLFGRESFDLLFPERPLSPDLDPIIPNGTSFDFQPIAISKPDTTFPKVAAVRTIDRPGEFLGSNNFAVGPQKTGDGAILANEPDLQLNLPSIWYIAHLNAPGINVFGSTLPGLPGVILGHNDSIAWGMTNAKQDLVDWYQIEFRSPERDEYRYDNKWLKTDKVVEEIKIRNGSTFYDTLIFTHYGPVVYDRNFPGNGENVNLAMRWTAHDPGDEVKALYQINTAKNHDDFRAALRFFTGPPQNFAFASVTGDIAIHIPGRFPIKWKEQGKFIMDGSKSSHDWLQMLPEEHKMWVKNPPRGFVSSANQHPVDSTYPYYVYDYKYEHYRGRRVNDRLKILPQVTVEDVMNLQNDNFNYRAFESLPMMLDSLDTTSFDSRKRDFFRLMQSWDYFNNPESKAATVYSIWWDKLYDVLWDEFDDQEVSLIKPHVYSSINILKNHPDNEFVDIKSTPEKEVAIDLFERTFTQTIDSLENWVAENGDDYSWSIFKNTRVQHLLRIDEFSVDKVNVGGDYNIVNAASSREGPSWRMVVQLNSDGVKSWGVYPGSQTGNPGNPSYAGMIEDWATGNYYEMVFPSEPLQEDDRIIFTQDLQPTNP